MRSVLIPATTDAAPLQLSESPFHRLTTLSRAELVATRDVPAAERIERAHKLIVLHPRFREAVELLKQCHDTFHHAGEPAAG